MRMSHVTIVRLCVLAIAALLYLIGWSGNVGASSILDVDFRELVSRADLHYDEQVRRPGEALPVGNGTMGSLVWTTPKQLRLQVNRVDVYCANSKTNSFPFVDTDYSHGCAFVDFSFADFGPDVFPAESVEQHLSVYDGLVTIDGNDVKAEVFAWPHGDVMAVRITDERRNASSIRVTLRALRPIVFQRRNHFAFTHVDGDQGKITLRQQFTEGDDSPNRTVFFPHPEATSIENRIYYCGSSVAVNVQGREAQVKQLNDGAIQLVAKPGKGCFTVLISSAATFDIEEDVNSLALAKLDEAASMGDAKLTASAQKWWHDFWANSFIHLSSEDGEAEFVEKHYTYFLYLMASCSRGAYPPRYSGMLWNTDGDVRRWGSMKWMYNLFCYYNNVLLAANKIELTNPLVEMFHKNYSANARAARQTWGSKGIYIPETTWFDAPPELPEDIAAEMRDLYLARKPWSEASKRFIQFAETKNAFDSLWCWKNFDEEQWRNGRHFWEPRESAPYSYVLHLFAPGAKIAYFHWQRYDYTQDKQWLREYGYPIIRGVTEFYRNYPNLKEGADGKYHIHGVNNWESTWGASDTIEELSAMRGVTETAIRASEELGVDEEMRPVWQEFLENMTPLPMHENDVGERFWVNTKHLSLGRASTNRRATTPCTFYDLFTLETTDPEMIELALNSYIPYAQRGGDLDSVSELSKATVVAATMGDDDGIRNMIPAQIRRDGLEEGYPDLESDWARWRGPLRNRMSLMEGYQGMGAQRLGNCMNGLVLSLCRAMPPSPAGKTVICVFPAWPREWNAAFTLLTRGNFLVTSSMRAGEIEFVEIMSRTGGECRLRNPWGAEVVATVFRDGKAWKTLKGSLISFDTEKEETFVVVREGTSPDHYKRDVTATPSEN